MIHAHHQNYRFGSRVPLSPKAMEQLANCFQSPQAETPTTLAGRGSIHRLNLDEIGMVIVKTFRRGGLLGQIIHQTYLGAGKSRSRAEFEHLVRALAMGVQVPEPVAYARKGTLFYQNWLITHEIPRVQSLVQLSQTTPEQIPDALQSLGQQVAILMDHRILHADFHPGNVLIDEGGRVFLIDFDKTAAYHGSRQQLQSKYQQRWCRAVQKHSLPLVLAENTHRWLS